MRKLLICVDAAEQHLNELAGMAQRFPESEFIVNHMNFTIKKEDGCS